MSELVWWPNWYITRLHCVVGLAPDVGAFAQPLALCGSSTIHPARASRLDWQGQRMARDIPRCKHCERLAGTHESETTEHSEGRPYFGQPGDTP